MFKNTFKLSIVIILALFSLSFSQDIIYVDKGMIISNGKIKKSNFPVFKSIDLLNYYFNGYLVIGNKLPLNTNGQFLDSKIYWIESLLNIDSSNYYYYYYPLLADATLYHAYMKNNSENLKDSSKIITKWFCKFYSLFNHANHRDFSTYLYEPKDWLYSDSLNENLNYWQNGSEIFYVIFKCSFTTSITTVSMPLTLIDNSEIDTVKILVPVSRLYEFRQITGREALDAGLTISKYSIKSR